jgi:hypothetical protein
MLKRLGMTGALVAILGLAAGATGPAFGSAGDDGGHHRTFSVVSHNTEEEGVDVGAKGDSLGDEYVFRSTLTSHGKTVGHAGVVCTLVSVKHGEAQCLGTAWFRAGQITIQGLIAGEPEHFVFPITGGSGAYKGAEGVLHVREGKNTERLTFHLTD